MEVQLIQHTPDPEKTVAAAAKLCYSDAGAMEICNGLTEDKTEKFLSMLMSLGHASPIEHVSFTFAIEGVSRSLLAQITRHRIASYSVKSQRYVQEGCFAYIIPPEIEAIPEAKKIYMQTMENDQKAYDQLTDILKKKHTDDFLAQGMELKNAEKKAEKAAIEDARFVLPNACETKMVVTMNARSLMNFFAHRCCMRAQWEIRELADKMLEQVKQVAPTLFRLAGPSCVGGACPEGKMTCGNAVEMRKKYINSDK